MRTIAPPARALYDREMTAGRTAPTSQERWRHLERGHIISQPHPWLHTRNHVAMLALALAQRNRGEALGQVNDLLARFPELLAGNPQVEYAETITYFVA